MVFVLYAYSSNRFPEVKTPEFTRRRDSLRRVSVLKSPGGTLQYPDRSGLLDCEYGAGPTPMLTRALRRKFQVSLEREILVTSPHKRSLLCKWGLLREDEEAFSLVFPLFNHILSLHVIELEEWEDCVRGSLHVNGSGYS